jgi:hypothetical protein
VPQRSYAVAVSGNITPACIGDEMLAITMLFTDWRTVNWLESPPLPPVVTVITSPLTGWLTEAEAMFRTPLDHAPAVADPGDSEPVVSVRVLAPE